MAPHKFLSNPTIVKPTKGTSEDGAEGEARTEAQRQSVPARRDADGALGLSPGDLRARVGRFGGTSDEPLRYRCALDRALVCVLEGSAVLQELDGRRGQRGGRPARTGTGTGRDLRTGLV